MSEDGNTLEALHARVTAAAQALSEHCDSVVIVCTLRERGGTYTSALNVGNIYASVAAAEEWVSRAKAEPFTRPQSE